MADWLSTEKANIVGNGEQPAIEWRETTSEDFDGRSLGLSKEQEEALEALAAFAKASPPTGRFARRALGWETAWKGVLGKIGDGGQAHPASVGLAAAAAVIQAGLPSCPYQPAGSPVTIQFLPPNNATVLRCHHTNPAHCWAGVPATPYEC
jgi:hypothetical protein